MLPNNGILQGSELKWTPRIAGYSTVLILLVVFNIVLFLTRNPLDITVMRIPGVLYQETVDGKIVNLYNLKIINKSSTDKPITVKLKAPPGVLKIIGRELIARQNELIQSVVVVEIDRENIKFINTPVYIDIFADNQQIKEIRTSFIGPDIRNSK